MNNDVNNDQVTESYNQEKFNGTNELKSDTTTDINNNTTQNVQLQKVKKTYKILIIISLILAIIRIPFLASDYLKYRKYIYYLYDGRKELFLLILGIISILMHIITIIMNENKKVKYILGLMSGLLAVFTGNIFACLFGILIIIDSIRAIRNIK